MPTATFETWQAAPMTSRVVLCHVTVRQTLRGFTSLGGGVYAMQVSAWTHPEDRRADRGLYREIVGVKDNLTALVLEGGPGGVASTPGSWYWGPSSELLYVQRSGGGNPDTEGTRIQVIFLLRLSTEAPTSWQQFPNQAPYYPLLDGTGLPQFEQVQTHPLAPVSSYPSGRVTFVNAGGVFDYLAVAYDWPENDVVFLVGGGGCGYGDYEVMVRAQVSRAPAAKNDLCEVLLRAASNVTNTAFPRHTYDEFWPAVPAVRGKYMPMWWGTVYDVPLQYVTAGGAGRDRYIVIDPLETYPTTSIEVVALRAYDRATGAGAGVLAAGSDYLLTPFYGYLDVDNTAWPLASYRFAADVVRVNGAGARILQTKGAIARDLLAACGIAAGEIDAAAFAQAEIDDPEPVGLYVAGNDTDATALEGGGDFFSVATSVQQLLDRLAPFFQVFRTPAGLWTCRVWDPSVDLTAPVVTSADLLTFEPIVRDADADGLQLQSSVTVRYGKHWHTGESASVTVSSGATAALIGRANSGHPFESPYVSDAANLVLAGRLLALAGVVPREYHAGLGPRLLLTSIGDKCRVIRARGPSVAATFDQVLEIQEIRKRLNDMSCDVVLGNMRGLGAGVKGVAPDGTAAYVFASDDDRAGYIFVVDEATLRAQVADPASYRQHMIW